jgi:hypothetical protein
LGLAGDKALIMRRLLMPLTLAIVSLHAGQAGAQGGFPAPLPGQASNNASPFPPVNGAAPSTSVGAAPASPFPSAGAAPLAGAGMQQRPAGPPPGAGGGGEKCMAEFVPLREEAERRGKLIKAASDRHAPPDEACKLIASYGQAEVKMLKYVETHSAQCGIPPQIADQLKTGHNGTDALQKKVCNVAQQMQQRGPSGPTLSDVLGSSAQMPEATASRKGGSTFDTLNGNVLAR